MKIKLSDRQYKKLLREFTEVMVMCTPWKKCMDDPYGENEETKWFIGRLDYNEDIDSWHPYSQDSNIYKTRDEATQAYFNGFYGKEPLMEMRFDGKSTGLFSSEEPQPINEFGEKFKEGWSKFLSAAKREGKETAIAAQILKRMVTRKKVSEDEKKFLKNQSIDLLKIVGVLGLGAVSSVIPVALEKMLNKKEIEWIDKYHSDVKSNLLRFMNEQEKKWLIDQTSPLIN